MINGAHIVVHSRNADADRAFFRDVLGFASVDAGNGWLIFGLIQGPVARRNGRPRLSVQKETGS